MELSSINRNFQRDVGGTRFSVGDFSASLVADLLYQRCCYIYGEFCSSRVVLFNWKARQFFVELQLSLCRDIYFGPNVSLVECVADDDKTICCDGCNQWIHVNCNQY